MICFKISKILVSQMTFDQVNCFWWLLFFTFSVFVKLDINSFIVNARLAGEKSEDPKFPKIQYPSNDECALCKTADDFEMEETLKYLDYRYSKENLVLADGEKMVDNSRMEDDADEVVEAIIEKPK